jgi:hypothetical protein
MLRNRKQNQNNFSISDFYVSKTNKFLLGPNIYSKVRTEQNEFLGMSPDIRETFDNYRRSILTICLITTVLHLIIGSLYLGLSVGYPDGAYRASLYSFLPNYDPSTNSLGANPNLIASNYPLWPIVIVIPFGSIIFLLIIIISHAMTSRSSTQKNEKDDIPCSEYYISSLLLGLNWFNWLDSSIIGGVMLWVVSQYAGIMDIVLLIILVVLNFVLNFSGGFGTEISNNGITMYNRFDNLKKEESSDNGENITVINFWPLLFGYVIPAAIVLTSIFTSAAIADTNAKPNHLQWISWVVIALFALLLLVTFLTIFIRYLILPTTPDLSTSSTGNRTSYDKSYFIQNNGSYEVAKLIINGVFRIVFIIVLIIAIFVPS